MELDFSPSVTCGDTSLIKGRLPSGFLVIPLPSFRPFAENPPVPLGRLNRTVKTVPYICHCEGVCPWQSVKKEHGFFTAFRMTDNSLINNRLNLVR